MDACIDFTKKFIITHSLDRSSTSKIRIGGRPSTLATKNKLVWFHRLNWRNAEKHLCHPKPITCTKSVYAAQEWVRIEHSLFCNQGSLTLNVNSIILCADIEEEAKSAVQIKAKRWIWQSRFGFVWRSHPYATIQAKDIGTGRRSGSGPSHTQDTHHE